jgi:hypothetical protein
VLHALQVAGAGRPLAGNISDQQQADRQTAPKHIHGDAPQAQIHRAEASHVGRWECNGAKMRVLST